MKVDLKARYGRLGKLITKFYANTKVRCLWIKYILIQLKIEWNKIKYLRALFIVVV
jgi:hypothetical protein